MVAPSRLASRERVLSWVFSLALVLLLWGVTAHAGAVGIARADDWSYLITQFDFLRDARFILNNWAVTMLIGQTAVAWPITLVFGQSIVALQAFVALCGFIALPLIYGLLRRYLTAWPSAVAVACLAVGPIFGPSLVSFMTDVPALLLLTLALVAGIRSVRDTGVSFGWLAMSAVLGVVAFTFRDYALVSLVAVLVVALLRVRANRRALASVLAIGIAAFTMAALLYRWRHGLPYDLKLDGWSFAFSMTLVARALLTVALLVSPVLLLVSPLRVLAAIGRRWWIAVSAAVVLTGGVVLLARLELLGNVLHPYGDTWLIAGSGVRMWPLLVNRLVVAIAVLAFAYLLVLTFAFMAWGLSAATREGLRGLSDRQVRAHAGRLMVLLYPVLLLGAHIAATSLLGTWLIDRYFILLVPFLAGAILIGADATALRVAGGWRSVAPVGLVAYAVMGLHVIDFNAVAEGSRWRLAEQLVAAGATPESVDGGLQWVSFHESGPGLAAQVVPTRPGHTWWTERYPGRRICQTIVAVDDGASSPAGSARTQQVQTLLGRTFTLAVVPGPDSCPGNL